MTVQRKFITGEEWLYLKIYAGLGFQDKLLLDGIPEIVEGLYGNKIIDKFFFVRYTDHDGPHLRLRFHLLNPSATFNIIELIQSKFSVHITSRAIGKVCWDTYARELERYGEDYIEDIESVFSINSWQVLMILRQNTVAPGELWLTIAKLTDQLLTDFGFKTNQKYILMEQSYQYYYKIFGATREIKEVLKGRYRENSKKMKQVIITGSGAGYSPVNELSGNIILSGAIAAIREKCIKNESEDRFIEICRSIIHMFYNRSFSFNQNTFELVIYYMLSNFYKSEAVLENRGNAVKMTDF